MLRNMSTLMSGANVISSSPDGRYAILPNAKADSETRADLDKGYYILYPKAYIIQLILRNLK